MPMTYDDVTQALAKEGFSTFHREDTDTLVCSSAEWPTLPQQAHSFWVAQRGDGWYLGTWAPHVYRFPDPSRIPGFCITWLRQHPTRAQWDVDETMKREFHLLEIDPDDLPTA